MSLVRLGPAADTGGDTGSSWMSHTVRAGRRLSICLTPTSALLPPELGSNYFMSSASMLLPPTLEMRPSQDLSQETGEPTDKAEDSCSSR